MMMKKLYHAAMLVVLCVGFTTPLYAAEVAPIENYLSGLKTMVAKFQQVAPDGSLSNGTFQLKRPYQMRWQYNPPTPILMVTRENYLTYFDRELNQVSDIPLEDTPFGILSQQKINLSDDSLVIAEHYTDKDKTIITLMQKDKEDQGSLSMIYRTTPMQLQGLEVVDATGQTTQISLSDIQENVPLEDKAFYFKNPNTGGKRSKAPNMGGF